MNMSSFMFLLLRFFFNVFIVNFKQISHPDLLLSIISLVLRPEEATKGVL